MSRIGKLPIQFGDDVTVDVKDGKVSIKGPKGELSYDFGNKLKISVKDKEIFVERHNDSKEQKALHGTIRSLIANMVEGVTHGFKKSLEVIGVGYRAIKKDKEIELYLGFSHPVSFRIPEGINIDIEKNIIHVSGINKQLVGEVAANIRRLKKPEPYKGKGIKYIDEQIRRKAGKAGKAGGAPGGA